MEMAWMAPALAGAGAALEIFRRAVILPHMAARRAEREAVLSRLARLEEEVAATRREVHELAGLLISRWEARHG